MVLRTREIQMGPGCVIPEELRKWSVPLEALIPAIQNICTMPSPEHATVSQQIDTPTGTDASLGRCQVYTPEQLAEELDCSHDRLSKHADTLQKVGLNPFSFIALYAASLWGTRRDQEKIIEKVEKPLRKRIKMDRFDSHHLSRETREIHKNIMRELLGPLIARKEADPDSKQKIVMIVGPFASGKTEIFENNYSTEDFFMLDLDIIRDRLARAHGYDNVTDEAVIQKFRRESWYLSDKLFRIALRNKLSVVIQTSLHRKERWLHDHNLLYAKKHGIPIEMVAILRPIHDLIFRSLHRKRGVLISDMNNSLRGMANIKKFVQKFGNVTKVLVYDFYDIAKKRHGEDTLIYSQQYKDFISYTKDPFKVPKEGRKNIFTFAKIEKDVLVMD